MKEFVITYATTLLVILSALAMMDFYWQMMEKPALVWICSLYLK